MKENTPAGHELELPVASEAFIEVEVSSLPSNPSVEDLIVYQPTAADTLNNMEEQCAAEINDDTEMDDDWDASITDLGKQFLEMDMDNGKANPSKQGNPDFSRSTSSVSLNSYSSIECENLLDFIPDDAEAFEENNNNLDKNNITEESTSAFIKRAHSGQSLYQSIQNSISNTEPKIEFKPLNPGFNNSGQAS